LGVFCDDSTGQGASPLSGSEQLYPVSVVSHSRRSDITTAFR
jgi:hypothetical protein